MENIIDIQDHQEPDYPALAAEKIAAELKDFSGGQKEKAISKFAAETVTHFCQESQQFAQVVYKTRRTLSDCCKKDIAHKVQKDYEMIITGERRAEGCMRSVPRKDSSAMCFTETGAGQYRLRPLYYVTDEDKAWYKDYYHIRYSDAYEVYGLTRTGCCGCPISYKAVEDLEKIRPYEPNLVRAAWNVFGQSYEYRARYVEYKKRRAEAEKCLDGQLDLFGGEVGA